ncbi:MAG: hypothetical protein AAFN63_01830 [Pseudomonadota bacterium]
MTFGAETDEQLADNRAAADPVLETNEMHRLSTVSSTGDLPYPYNSLRDRCGLDIWPDLKT